MVFEDWRFPKSKSKEILQESHIKIGPKRVCKDEAKVSQKGAKVGARNRQFFEKYQKKGVPKIDAKKGRICEAPKSDCKSTPCFPWVDFRAGGEGFREGNGYLLVGSRVNL
jgi:hypothetical protein